MNIEAAAKRIDADARRQAMAAIQEERRTRTREKMRQIRATRKEKQTRGWHKQGGTLEDRIMAIVERDRQSRLAPAA